MILAFALILVIAALSFDVLWLPALFCGVAAMQWTASLHPADPLAPLYAFFVAGVAARTAIALLFQRKRPHAG